MPLVTATPFRGPPPWSMFDGSNIGTTQTLFTITDLDWLHVSHIPGTTSAIVGIDQEAPTDNLTAFKADISGTTITTSPLIQHDGSSVSQTLLVEGIDSGRYVHAKRQNTAVLDARIGTIGGSPALDFNAGSSVVPFFPDTGANVRFGDMKVLSSNKILYAGNSPTGTPHRIVVLTIDGSPNTNLSVGTPSNLTFINPLTQGGRFGVMSPTSAVYRYTANSNPYVVGMTIGGSPDVDLGTPLQLATSVDNGGNRGFAVLSSTKGVAIYRNNASSDVRARVVTLTGNSVSAGTELDVVGSNSDPAEIVGLTEDKAMIIYRKTNTTNRLTCRILEVSGTTLSFGTGEIEISTDINATRMRAVKISPTAIFVCWYRFGDNVKGVVIED